MKLPAWKMQPMASSARIKVADLEWDQQWLDDDGWMWNQ
jgi:hypothetical protein